MTGSIYRYIIKGGSKLGVFKDKGALILKTRRALMTAAEHCRGFIRRRMRPHLHMYYVDNSISELAKIDLD